MKQILCTLLVAGGVACITAPVSASIPTHDVLSLEPTTLISASHNPTDTMLAQCYGGGYYSSYDLVPVRRSYYYPRQSGVSIQLGGRPYYNGYRGYGGYGHYGRGYYGRGGRGYGRGFGGGGSGFGLHFSF